jgi:hypothetical protein
VINYQEVQARSQWLIILVIWGWDLEDHGSRPAQAKSSWDPPSQWKKLGVVVCTCHPIYHGKHSIGGSLSRLVQESKQPSHQKKKEFQDGNSQTLNHMQGTSKHEVLSKCIDYMPMKQTLDPVQVKHWQVSNWTSWNSKPETLKLASTKFLTHRNFGR